MKVDFDQRGSDPMQVLPNVVFDENGFCRKWFLMKVVFDEIFFDERDHVHPNFA